MQRWAILFAVTFGGVELYQWLLEVALPFPVFAVVGVLLAIASNANKTAGLPWQHLQLQTPLPPMPAKSQVVTPLPQAEQPSPQPRRSPELPNLTPNASQPQQSISFTIRKPD